MKRSSTIFLIVIILVLVGVLGGLLLHRASTTSGIIKDSGANMSDYSAVFVQGGGIYFGKITSLTSDVLSLDNVYTYGVVPSNSTSTSTNNTNQSTKPTLFDASKVGIAPSSHYNINRSQVILWYSLTSDSQVVKTIQSYQQSNQ